MHRIASFTLTYSATLALLFASGCASEAPADPEPLISTPLPLDPTDDYDFRGWWVGEEQMLVLNRDQSYILYNGLNQYLSPKQRGRWMQLTYASLRLEPYGRYVPEPMRVRVELINGERTLNVPQLGTMFASHAPPKTAEDDLMGAWDGDAGDLNLTADMRYVYTPSALYMNAHATVMPAGQRGSWVLVGDDLILRPDSPAFDRMVLKVSGEDEQDRLTGESVAFERAGSNTVEPDDGDTNATDASSST